MGFLFLPFSATAQLSPSQYEYPYNHLSWYSINSEHFSIHFQEGNRQSAIKAAEIAEKIYPKITSLYHHKPDSKVNIVLNDRQDYSNGAAYFFDNQIDIWVPALDSKLRGTHLWLWDVITHEFTHIVQLQKAMKKSRTIPAIYFQWLTYSEVRRPDVLYGYPKGLLTYPFASINVPPWFAEGAAQYQRGELYYDFWDSHRDMLFRTAVMDGKPLAFDEMGFFSSKNALEREQIYNQGFAFTTYLADKFGEDILPKTSKALASSGTFTIDKALKTSTGISGKKLFEDFLDHSEKEYSRAIQSLEFQQTNIIEKEGFYNFYPEISASENKLAYLTNKYSQNSSSRLVIRSISDTSGAIASIEIGKPHKTAYPIAQNHSRKPLINHISSSFSFSPDGDSLVFSRQKLNRYGEQYNDLYVFDLESHKEKRLTNSERLSSPEWHPSQNIAVAVQQTQGSTNLTEIDLSSGTTTRLTDYENGEQVFTPVWHPNGDKIYFARAGRYSRNIFSYNLHNGIIQRVLEDKLIDYRDPFIDKDGDYLYFASNPDGIYNIYRIPLDNKNASPQKLTNVPGGTFMPNVSNGILYLSEYKSGGYKISSAPLDSTIKNSPAGSYNLQPSAGFKLLDKQHLDSLDYSIHEPTITESQLKNLGPSDSLSVQIGSEDKKNPVQLKRYENVYNDFTLYPVIRFDNYSQKYGNNGRLLTAARFGDLGRNLLRDMKLGAYYNSQEVTGKLSLFGGALFGVASEPADGVGDFFSPSRLTDLDRDLFLTAEYRGIPFIEKRWSPTITLEINNIRRNVANGLSIEEFPCTSCLPDTTHADIAYNVWEANLKLLSKIDEKNLIELGVGYSPYKIQTDQFYSRELQQLIPSSSSVYFKGTTFTAAHIYENFVPYPNSDVAPLGLRTLLRYSYEPSKLLEDYEIEDNTLSPVYKSTNNHSIETSIRYGYSLSGHTALSLYGRGFSYLNNPNDFFYLDYIGGFTGMRSYPYFALGGNRTAMVQISYTFPLLRDINEQWGRHSLDKLYLRLYGEAGNGWGGPLKIGENIKTGLGAEFRFAFNSYYLFPIKMFLSGSYGFNDFDVTLPDAFITNSASGKVPYGNDLLLHFGLTFDFNVLNND